MVEIGVQMRIYGWTGKSAEELWLAWLGQFASQEEAIARAMWITNRLIKGSGCRYTAIKFYSIKDHYLSLQESVGQRVRLEEKICFRCNGGGCERCGYEGVYQSRWLYTHEFFIAGQRYSFHSHVCPKVLLDEMAENVQFGTKFSDEEIGQLALPMTGMVKVLCYVAAVVWGLDWNGRRYVAKSGTSPARVEHKRPVVKRPKFSVDDVRYWWTR